MKLRLAQPSVLVDIGRLSDLSYIRDAGDHIAIGALTRHMDVERARCSPSTCRCSPTRPATSATRRCATAARSVARSPTADPASDLPATTLALGATYVAQGPNGTREIAADRLLPGLPQSRARGRRDAHRDPRAEDERCRLELPEVQPPRPGLGDRRCGRLARNGESGVGLVNMGSTPILATSVSAALASARVDRRRRRAGGRRGRAAERPQRLARVPRAPRQGARASGARGSVARPARPRRPNCSAPSSTCRGSRSRRSARSRIGNRSSPVCPAPIRRRRRCCCSATPTWCPPTPPTGVTTPSAAN
jgi:hypothetical protein